LASAELGLIVNEGIGEIPAAVENDTEETEIVGIGIPLIVIELAVGANIVTLDCVGITGAITLAVAIAGANVTVILGVEAEIFAVAIEASEIIVITGVEDVEAVDIAPVVIVISGIGLLVCAIASDTVATIIFIIGALILPVDMATGASIVIFVDIEIIGATTLATAIAESEVIVIFGSGVTIEAVAIAFATKVRPGAGDVTEAFTEAGIETIVIVGIGDIPDAVDVATAVTNTSGIELTIDEVAVALNGPIVTSIDAPVVSTDALAIATGA
jgi:hypothetical protein